MMARTTSQSLTRRFGLDRILPDVHDVESERKKVWAHGKYRALSGFVQYLVGALKYYWISIIGRNPFWEDNALVSGGEGRNQRESASGFRYLEFAARSNTLPTEVRREGSWQTFNVCKHVTLD
jgi:hypothetical protein